MKPQQECAPLPLHNLSGLGHNLAYSPAVQQLDFARPCPFAAEGAQSTTKTKSDHSHPMGRQENACAPVEWSTFLHNGTTR